jgi:hypothetical protein
MEPGKDRPAPLLTETGPRAVPDREPQPRKPASRPSSAGRVPPSAAVIARPMLLLLPIVTFLVPALVITMAQKPTYTAESRLLVGGFNVDAQAVPGFVEAARTLAATYARLVDTPVIDVPVAEALDISPDDVSISATSVPESSIIRIQGTSSSEERAIQLADAAADALLEYADTTASSAAGAEQLLQDYQAAAQRYNEAEAERARLAAAAGDSPGPELRQQIAAAEARAAAEQLRAESLAQQYADRERGGNQGLLDVVAPAASNGSDRRSKVQLAVAAAVGMGLVVGVALATLVVNRQSTATRAR